MQEHPAPFQCKSEKPFAKAQKNKRIQGNGMNAVTPFPCIFAIRGLLLVRHAGLVVSAEQKGNVPDACNANQRIDNAADDGSLTAKEPGYQVKLEKTHKAPVEGADDRKYQCQRIHVRLYLSFIGMALV